MKLKNPKIWLLLAGVVAIAGAWWYRQHIFARKYALQIALQNPKAKAIARQLDSLKQAVDAHPNDVAARWKLADMFQKLGTLDLALEQLQAIAKLQPDDLHARLAIADTEMALFRAKDAENAYRDVLRRWPRNVAAWQGLAAVLYGRRRYDESMEAIRHALVLKPEDPNSHFILANSMLQFANQFPDTSAFATYAQLAQAEFEKLLRVWPEPGEIEFRLGEACTLLREQLAAVDHYQKALARLPNRPEIYSNLAAVQMAMGNRTGARQTVETALTHHVDSPELRDLHGQLLQTTGEPGALERALAEFAAAVKAAPKVGRYHEHYGAALVRANRLPEARDEFIAAVTIDPNRPYGYQQLSGIYTRLGDAQHANAAAKMANEMVANEQQLKQLQLISRAHPDGVQLFLILGDRYKDLGLIGAARHEYHRVLALDPNPAGKWHKRAAAGLAAIDQDEAKREVAQR